MTDLVVKSGASLRLAFAVANDDDTPYDLTSTTVTAQVRDLSGKLIATLDLQPSGTPGGLQVEQATDGWPVGVLKFDLKFVQGSLVLKSQTQNIVVSPAVTA